MSTRPASMIQPRRVLPRGPHRRQARPRRAFFSALWTIGVLGAGLLAGCAHSDAGLAPPPGIGGAYTLAVVGSDSLPAIVYDSTMVSGPYSLRVVIEITGGTMTLSSSGGYIFRMTYDYLVNGVAQPTVPLGDRGTYTREGAVLNFLSGDGQGTMSGTIAGGKLTMAQDLLDDGAPLSLLYER